MTFSGSLRLLEFWGKFLGKFDSVTPVLLLMGAVTDKSVWDFRQAIFFLILDINYFRVKMVISSSQMDGADARYAHILQPIKDMTKNWDVDIAAYLEDYLEEVGYFLL